LLSGDPNTAYEAVKGHNNGVGFEQDSDFQEVDALFTRTKPAIEKANKAAELIQQTGKAEEADALMHQAAEAYPEMQALRDYLPYFDAGAAFERKDYDKLLEFSEEQLRLTPDSGSAAGGVAGALACKYAVTGDPAWKQKAEEMLEKAHQLSQKSAEEQKSFVEYAERTRYRLSSREIIDKNEYDRRFRAGTAGKR